MPERVIVTGGAGYIGNHLVNSLISSGKHVTVIDNGSHAPQILEQALRSGMCDLVRSDIRDPASTAEAYRGCTAVFHLASIVGAPACNADRKSASSINVTGTEVVASLCAKFSIERFIFASTCSVYGISSQLINEASPVNPCDFYAETKVEAEAILQHYTGSLSVWSLRFGTAFGLSSRMRTDLVVNAMVVDAAGKGVITVRAPNNWRPFVHCRDIGRICAAAQSWPVPNESFETANVGFAQGNLRLIDLAKAIQQFFPSSRLEVSNLNSDNRSYKVSFAKLERLYGQPPDAPLKSGILEMSNWLGNGTSSYGGQLGTFAKPATLKPAVLQ
jgi:nucleoside-diphosphate-sugar epimerase